MLISFRVVLAYKKIRSREVSSRSTAVVVLIGTVEGEEEEDC